MCAVNASPPLCPSCGQPASTAPAGAEQRPPAAHEVRRGRPGHRERRGGNEGAALGEPPERGRGDGRPPGPAVPPGEPGDALARRRARSVGRLLDHLAGHVLARLPAVAAAHERQLAAVDGEGADGDERLVRRGRGRRDLAALGPGRPIGSGDDREHGTRILNLAGNVPRPMGSGLACRICSADVTLRIRGGGQPLTAAALSPSAHATGGHGDLVECRECGTVQQPELPAGAALHDLYRDMTDEAYLGEEAGRRATGARLLDLVARFVPRGRLLDVGCGPGLLLDEARRRGYDPLGLELSRASARHARDALGLDVRELALEDFVDDGGGFDVVVLADVIEHLDDPVGGIARCAALLRPGGVLCVVTPDPSSPTARAAGRRWWGYVPAHTCLLPRATLRELLAAAGLVVSTDVPLVRTFSARRWVEGLAERLGPLTAPLDVAARRLPASARLSLSLGDERVVLAHRTEVERPAEPLVRDRGGAKSVHVVLPAYRATRTIPDVVEEMPVGAADRALLVDDASGDGTSEVALRHGLEVLRHPANRGYGA